MGKMTYIPDWMMESIEIMKRAVSRGQCYDIICYDSKEERTKEEKFSPCTPFIKEEKKKEEKGTHTPLAREILPVPTLAEVVDFARTVPNVDFTPEYFFHRNEARGWKIDGKDIDNWQSLFLSWHEGKKGKNKPSRAARSEARQQRLLAAETQRLEKSNREIAEREARQAREASEAISYEEYLRRKKEGLTINN